MLKIKLARIGKNKTSQYRIVVAERRSPRNGRFIDQLGFYQPQSGPAGLTINRRLLTEWLKKGAQPTATLKKLLAKHEPTA
jgi:small subunit ribosomal protein S16